MNLLLKCMVLVFLTFTVSTSLYAQKNSTTYEIQGTLIDSISESPLAYATIVLIQSTDGLTVDGVITNEQGFFKFENVEIGFYELQIEFIGYDKKVLNKVEISKSTGSIDLGHIRLSEMATSLDEVVIQAEKPEFENKIDRLVYNIQNNSEISGGASELLRKMPMTTIDLNGNASLRGNGNVQILINGRLATGISGNNGEILQSIPASQIKSVEIITSPSAKYDAEGSGGMINIITRKATINGVNGTVTGEIGTRLWNSSVSVYGKYKKLIFGMSLGINNKFPRTVQNDYFSLDDRGNSSSSLEAGKNERLSNSASATLQYDFNEKNSISSSFRAANLGFNDDLLVLSENISVGSNPIRYETETDGERRINGFNWSADYLHKFSEKGEILSLASQWKSNLRNEDYQSLFSDFFVSQEAQSEADSNEYTVQLDYVKPIKESGKLEVGVKSIFRDIESVNDFFDVDANGNGSFNGTLSNILNYQQDVYAAYVSLQLDLGKGWNLQAGNRFEATRIKGESSNFQTGIVSFTNDFNNNAPSLILLKEFADFTRIKISYNKRIQRPSLEYINPFRDTADPLNQSQGTPDLTPEVAETVELTFNPFIKNVSTNFSIYYRRTDDIIESFTETVPFTNDVSNGGDSLFVNLTTFQNVGSSESFGLSLFGASTIKKKLDVQGSFDVFTYRARVDSMFENFSNPGTFFQYNGFVSLGYQLPYKMTFSTFYSFQSKFRNFQGTTANLNIWNLSLRKEILKGKGIVGFSVTNPLNDTWDFVDNVQTSTITTRNTLTVPLRTFNIKFSYNFGKSKENRPEERGVKNTDLKNKRSD